MSRLGSLLRSAYPLPPVSWDRSVFRYEFIAALPPLAAISPARLNGTIGVYCQESPSTKFVPLVGLKLPVHWPLESRGWMYPLAGLNRLRQFCARLARAVWSVVSPSAPAKADNAKLALSYSRLVEAGP